MTKFYQKLTLNYSSLYKIIFIVFIAAFTFSCNKEDEIGLDLLPQKEMLNLEDCDTILLKSHTFMSDTFLVTKNNDLGFVGNYQNPIFGYNSASFLTEIRLSSSEVDFPEIYSVNDFTLSLQSNGFYGNADDSITIDVYKVLKEINTETEYTVFNESEYVNDTSFITSYTFIPPQADEILNIPMPFDFANELLGYDEQEFFDNIKGLYLTVSQTSSSILYFNLLSDKSYLGLEYIEPTNVDTIFKTTNFAYLINSNCERRNVFTHDYPDELELEIELGDESISGVNYIQAMSGLGTIIEMPDLKEIMQNKNIAITKAEFVISEHEDYISEDYPACEKLNMVLLYDTSGYFNLPDVDIVGKDHFTGYYTNNTYTFNVTAYIQYLIINDYYDGFKLFVYADPSTMNAGNVVINSGSSSSNRIKLKLYYLKL